MARYERPKVRFLQRLRNCNLSCWADAKAWIGAFAKSGQVTVYMSSKLAKMVCVLNIKVAISMHPSRAATYCSQASRSEVFASTRTTESGTAATACSMHNEYVKRFEFLRSRYFLTGFVQTSSRKWQLLCTKCWSILSLSPRFGDN